MKVAFFVMLMMIAQACGMADSAMPDSNLPDPEVSYVDGEMSATDAFNAGTSNVQVHGTGTVTRILSDDNEGGRHQRFILDVGGGHTVLIAHNIDIAPRIDGLGEGDSVEFYGEYEYTELGGTVHWTHHDPDGGHEHGWLKWNGNVYE